MVVTDLEDRLPHDEVLHPVRSPIGGNPDRPGINFGAARAALSTATEGTTRGPNRAGRAQLVISLLPEGGVVPDGSAGLAAVPYLLHTPERFCGTAGFHVFLQRTALTEEKRRPFLGPKTPCFLTPLLPKHKLLSARSVVGSVATSASLVLYVFASLRFFLWRHRGLWGGSVRH